MNSNINVSIIIPVYNSEKFLENLLDDLIAQSYPYFEVILINDGSKDGSEAILKRYEQKDDRIHYITVENSGVSEARNTGIALAKGKYIRFIDADDRLETDSIETMIEAAQEDQNVDLVIGSFRSIPEVNLYYGEHAISGKQTLEQMALDFLFNIRSFYYGVVWNKLYKKEIIQENNLKFNKEIAWCEDFLFNLEYFKCCRYFYILPFEKKIYNYIQHETSTTKLLSKLPEGKIDEINELRTESTKVFFEHVGLGDKLQLEWKYSFLFFNLLELPKEKESSLKEKYNKLKMILAKEDVYEYIKLKKDYFSDDFFYRMVFFSVRKKVYMPLFIYILIHGWLAKHMNWLKYLWLKIGGKRPKVL